MDVGSHSKTCAEAVSGICHCECHGTGHGVIAAGHKKLDHKHGPGVTITKHVGPGGGYTVVNKKTGLPPGGGTATERHEHHMRQIQVGDTTKTTKKGRALPHDVSQRARDVRAALPKTHDEWKATIPRGKTGREKLLAEADAYAKRAAEIRAEHKAKFDKLAAEGQAAGLSEMSVRHKAWEQGLDHLKLKADEAAAIADGKRSMADSPYAQVTMNASSPEYPMDAAGKYRMPSKELDAHLDAVLDVGRQALAAVHEHFDRDDELKALRGRAATRQKLIDERKAMYHGGMMTGDPVRRRAIDDELDKLGMGRDDTIAIRKREREILREIIGDARDMGGVEHNAEGLTPAGITALGKLHKDDTPSPALADWEKRVRAAEGHFPADWLKHSADAGPLKVGSSKRAFHLPLGGASMLAMPEKPYHYSGAYDDSIDEVTVHEMGHRMEDTVPGLKALEFAYVRRRSTKANGKLEKSRKLKNIYKGSGYRDHEVAFEDEWASAYAGKTYEGSYSEDPASQSWEVFQVGTQDLYGRDRRFDAGDELQAFTLGALLTLGRH